MSNTADRTTGFHDAAFSSEKLFFFFTLTGIFAFFNRLIGLIGVFTTIADGSVS